MVVVGAAAVVVTAEDVDPSPWLSAGQRPDALKEAWLCTPWKKTFVSELATHALTIVMFVNRCSSPPWETLPEHNVARNA